MVMQQEVNATDLEPIARQLAEQLVAVGLISPDAIDPHIRLEAALRTLITKQGDRVVDLAWKSGQTIRHYDENPFTGFIDGPGKAVKKVCRQLVLTTVPNRWSPR